MLSYISQDYNEKNLSLIIISRMKPPVTFQNIRLKGRTYFLSSKKNDEVELIHVQPSVARPSPFI